MLPLIETNFVFKAVSNSRKTRFVFIEGGFPSKQRYTFEIIVAQNNDRSIDLGFVRKERVYYLTHRKATEFAK